MKKERKFPDNVLLVKKKLQEANDPRLETMRLLTETRPDELYIDDLKIMWNRLAEVEGKEWLGNEPFWVYAFLNMVDKFRKHRPKHYSMNNADRKDLIKEIEGHTKKLTKIHASHDFAKKNVGDTSFVEILKSMAEHTIKELKETALEGKAGKNKEPIMFARFLARHNEMMGGEPLNSVIKTATFALYGIDYSDSDISNLLNR
jgi:hypothetical protein